MTTAHVTGMSGGPRLAFMSAVSFTNRHTLTMNGLINTGKTGHTNIQDRVSIHILQLPVR